MSGGGARFIKRNAPPRVQITYETDTRSGKEKVSLPFVMAVMGDFAGQTELPMIEEREFQEINAGTFEDRMASLRPTIQFEVDDKIGSGDDKLTVELAFESMKDFSPDRIAERFEPLQQLLRQRTQLKNFLSYIKTAPPKQRKEAEKRLLEAARDPAVLQALVAASAAPDGGADNAASAAGDGQGSPDDSKQ